MPLVNHSNLPSLHRLSKEGMTVLSENRAKHQDIRELHIGLLNLMPDEALIATERQFFRLVGDANPIAQFHVHPFTITELARGDLAKEHIDTYYESFEEIRDAGLDGLIITGANVSHPNLNEELFWNPLIRIMDWALESVTTILCSCLATHAMLQFRYLQRRKLQKKKTWGVFSHKVVDKKHPLVNNVNTKFDVPHSRWNDISRFQFEEAGLKVLVESAEAGVHLATSTDGFRIIFFQGHPEYDTVSLLKEYKRDLHLFIYEDSDFDPPYPFDYFDNNTKRIIEEYKKDLKKAKDNNSDPPLFPETELLEHIDNTWHDTAKAIVGNWIGLMYQVTNKDRKIPFMDGIDPQDPLNLKSPKE